MKKAFTINAIYLNHLSDRIGKDDAYSFSDIGGEGFQNRDRIHTDSPL